MDSFIRSRHMPSSPLHTQLLISFSGLDGCGKSTQIENLRSSLADRGLTVKVLAFWDDVVVLSRFREAFVHKVYRSERGVGSPERPVNRRDKNVRKWYLNVVRHGLYLLDALNLVAVIATTRRRNADVIIMDRYIYDELANLPLSSLPTRIFVRLVGRLVPHPDIAYLLDAEPETARARKPEYPVDFLHTCRHAYLSLAQVLGQITVIPPLPLAQTTVAVQRALALVLHQEQNPQGSQRKTTSRRTTELMSR
jgi:thymidylate kinase